MNGSSRQTAVPLLTVGLLILAFAGVVGMGVLQKAPAQGQESTPSNATPTPQSAATHRAQVDFGEPVGDTYLSSLLDQYQAKPVLAYMTTAGFFGVHRAATSTAPAVFIASARTETAGGFSNGAGSGITTRAGDFVGTYTAKDLIQNAEARERGESLLDLHGRLDTARSNAVDGRPLIHAVEVHGTEDQLRLLGAENRVEGFKIVVIDSDVHWPRPALAQGGVVGSGGSAGAGDSRSATNDPQTLYDRLASLASR